jgi:hypothetical protein
MTRKTRLISRMSLHKLLSKKAELYLFLAGEFSPIRFEKFDQIREN